MVGFISSVLPLVSDSELAFLRRIADFWTTFVPFAFAEAVLGVQLGNGVKFDDQGDDQGQVEAAFSTTAFTEQAIRETRCSRYVKSYLGWPT